MSVRAVAVVSLFVAALLSVDQAMRAAPSGAQLPERQLPVFRSDAHLVRVDAYPTAKDGSIVRGLTVGSFELTEDGKPQQIDSAEFIEYERWSPGSERPEVRTQRDSFRLAADPRYRVVVVYVDRLSWTNAHYVRQPLIDLLTREIGPRDLFGLLLPHHEASDLVLGQFTPGTQSLLTQFLAITDHHAPAHMDPAEQKLFSCYGPAGFGLIGRWRIDNLYRDLEGILTILGTIRDERKSLILVTETMPGVTPSRRGGGPPPATGARGRPPVQRSMPGVGGLSAGVFTPDFDSATACQMLASDIPDPHPQRFQNLLKLARRMNVTINPINPAGLGMSINWGNADLRRMADETGGLAIVNTNDIKGGFRRIANDQSAYYLLGYYTSNTKWDGRRRQIRVRLKPGGATIRARHEYAAPSEADMAAMRAAASAPSRPPGPTPVESALNALARLRPDAELHLLGAFRGREMAVAVEIPAATATRGRWSSGGEVEVMVTDADGRTLSGTAPLRSGFRGAEVRIPLPSDSVGPWQIRARVQHGNDVIEDHARINLDTSGVFGQPLLYRAAPPPAAPFRPVADLQFWRTERLRAEWSLPATLTPVHARARLLESGGRPLDFTPTVVTERADGRTQVRLDMSLASLAAADYLIEVVAEHDGQEDRTLLAIRVLR